MEISSQNCGPCRSVPWNAADATPMARRLHDRISGEVEVEVVVVVVAAPPAAPTSLGFRG